MYTLLHLLMESVKQNLRKKDQKISIRIALIYLVLSIAWILLSDIILLDLAPQLEDFAYFQSIKGVIFTIISAFVIFILIRINTNRKSEALFDYLAERKHYIDLKKQFRKLFEYSTNAVITHRIVITSENKKEFPVKRINNLFEQFFKVKRSTILSSLPESIHGSTYFETIHPRLEQIIEKGTPFVYEWFDNKNGRYFEELVFLSSSDELTRIITDKTSKKELETRLKESEARLKLALEASNVGIWDWNLREDKVFVDEQLEKNLGYESGEINYLSREDWGEIIHPEDKPEAQKWVKRIINNEIEKVDLILRFKNKKGHYKYIWDQAQVAERDSTENVLRMIGTHTDITKQIETERQLESNNRKLKVLIGNIRGIVFRCNLDEHYSMEFISEYCSTVTGYHWEEIYPNGPTSYKEIIHESDRDIVKNQIRKAYEKGKNYELVYRIITKKGETRGVREKGEFDTLSNWEVHIIRDGVIIDITDRVLLEETKLRSAVDTEDRDRARIAQKIHDGIQQYLFASLVNIENIIKKNNGLSDKMKERLQISFEYLNKSISETRGIAIELMPKNVQDFGLVQSIRHLINSLETNIDIHFYSNADQKRFAERLEISVYRIIQEALNNAIKYSEASDIQVQILLTEKNLSISIEDNGIGFVTDDTDTVHKGLGIQLMRNRTESHGGVFDISSKINEGTFIMINIPADYEKNITS